MMAAPCLAVRGIAKLRQACVEVVECGLTLLQEVGDQNLLALLDSLFFGEQLFNVVGALFFRHSDIITSSEQELQRLNICPRFR